MTNNVFRYNKKYRWVYLSLWKSLMKNNLTLEERRVITYRRKYGIKRDIVNIGRLYDL